MDIREFAKFAEALQPDDTPFTTFLGGPPKPDYYYATRQVPVEPLHTYWKKLTDILLDIRESHCPESEWDDDCQWTPSEEFYRIESLAMGMQRDAHRQEPNPKYDFYRAEEWDRMHPPHRPINQQRVEWGTGFVVPESDGGKLEEIGQEQQNGLFTNDDE